MVSFLVQQDQIGIPPQTMRSWIIHALHERLMVHQVRISPGLSCPAWVPSCILKIVSPQLSLIGRWATRCLAVPNSAERFISYVSGQIVQYVKVLRSTV